MSGASSGSFCLSEHSEALLQPPDLPSLPPDCSQKLQVRAGTQQRTSRRAVVVAAADNKAAAGFAAAALAAAILVNAPMAKADLVRMAVTMQSQDERHRVVSDW